MTFYSTLAFLGFILGFGFLVFIHELGHFLVAKSVGIKCTQFAIGFGPSIFAWRKGIGLRTGSTERAYEKRLKDHLQQKGLDPAVVDHAREDAEPRSSADQQQTSALIDQAAKELGLGETEYRLNYVPLGGYVKMLGQEDMDPTARSSDPRSFNAKPIWACAAVISAGVVMNIIVGMLFFTIAFSSGVEFPPAIVGRVVPNMPAAETYAVGHDHDPAYKGLQVGDRITQVDGETIKDMTELLVATRARLTGQANRLDRATPRQ